MRTRRRVRGNPYLTVEDHIALVTPQQFWSVTNSTPDKMFNAALASLMPTGGVLALNGDNVWPAAPTGIFDFAQYGKPVTIIAYGASVACNVAGKVITLAQSTAPATARSLSVHGGSWNNSVGDFWLIQDTSNIFFQHVKGTCPNGNWLEQRNVDFWCEDNSYINCDDQGCQRAFWFTCRPRVDAATVATGNPVVLDSSIKSFMTGRAVSGTGIPANTFVGTVVNGVSFRLSSSATSQVDVSATANGTSVTIDTDGSSHARTLIYNLKLAGGTSGFCKVDIDDSTTVVPALYGSTFDNIHGNINDGVVVQKLTGGMRGTRIFPGDVEASGGATTAAYFRLGTLVGTRPQIFGTPDQANVLMTDTVLTGLWPVTPHWFPAGLNSAGVIIHNKLTSTLTVNGALTFFVDRCNEIKIALQANLTGLTITNTPLGFPPGLNMQSGQRLTLVLEQDATGGRTYQAALAGCAQLLFENATPPSDTTASSVTLIDFIWSNTGSVFREISRRTLGAGSQVGERAFVFCAGGSAISWTAMPVAATEFRGNAINRVKADLSKLTQIRLEVNVSGVGIAGAVLRLQYSTDRTTWNDMTDGTNTASCPINANSANPYVSSWVTIPSGARSDLYLRIVGQGGDASTSPSFGTIEAHAR